MFTAKINKKIGDKGVIIISQNQDMMMRAEKIDGDLYKIPFYINFEDVAHYLEPEEVDKIDMDEFVDFCSRNMGMFLHMNDFFENMINEYFRDKHAEEIQKKTA